MYTKNCELKVYYVSGYIKPYGNLSKGQNLERLNNVLTYTGQMWLNHGELQISFFNDNFILLNIICHGNSVTAVTVSEALTKKKKRSTRLKTPKPMHNIHTEIW